MKSLYESHRREVEEKLRALPRIPSKHVPEDYVGAGVSRLKFLGLRSPQLDAVYKAGFSFSGGDPAKVARVWDHVWSRTECFEAMSLALSWFYDRAREPELPGYWPMLREWSARIDNWAHSDTLSGIYARILERRPSVILPTLRGWNRAEDAPWLNRLSIVSLIYYSSQRRRILPPAQILKMVKPLLDHEHYYVQKGVGWTLRELGNVHPVEARSFIEAHVAWIHPDAWSAAVEKWNPAEKARLQKLRKAARKGKNQ